MNRIRNDGALHRLPIWLTITMMTTSVLLGVVLWRQAAHSPDTQLPRIQLMVILWLAVATYMLVGDVRTRCQHLDMTLPIKTRTLWWNHQSAVVVAGAVVLAGSLAVLAGHALLIRQVNPQRALEIPYLTLIAPLGGGLLLAVSMIGSLEPGLWKLRGRIEYWVFVITSLAGILLILVLLQEKPWIAVQFCLLMAAVITYLTLHKLPPAYRLVPQCAAPADKKDAAAATTGESVSRWQIYRILFGVLHTTPPWKQFTPLMLYFFVALLGLLISGGLERAIEVQALRFMYLPMGSYMLLAGVGILTYHLHRFDPLPIPRRTLFGVMVLPGLLIFSIGYLAGWILLTTDPSSPPVVDFNVVDRHVEIDLKEGPDAEQREVEPMVWVEVDQAFMGVSLKGEPPMLTSPWGESHQAWSVELFRGLPPVLYSPYNTAEETTADFEALMASRAIEDVYGETVAPEVIRGRFFEIENDRVVGLRTSRRQIAQREGLSEAFIAWTGFSLLEEALELEPSSKGPEAPVYLALVMVPALLFTAFFVRSFRAEHSNKYIRAMYWFGLGILLAILIGQSILAILDVFDPDTGRGFLAVLIRQLGSSPLTTAVTWLVCAGLIFIAYRIAQAQFEKAEIPVNPINCSFMDFSKSD